MEPDLEDLLHLLGNAAVLAFLAWPVILYLMWIISVGYHCFF